MSETTVLMYCRRALRTRPYNLSTMPRWLIAVFTLHFLLSVGVSAFGKVPPVEHLRPAVASVQLAPAGEAAMAIAADPSVANDALSEGEHGLMDAQQDLPDDQNIRAFRGKPLHGLFSCPAQWERAALSPVLKKQPKPPRSLTTRA